MYSGHDHCALLSLHMRPATCSCYLGSYDQLLAAVQASGGDPAQPMVSTT